MNEQFSIAGKVAVITGAGGVLGGSIAKCFMQQGAKVVADRKSTRLNSSHSAKSRMPSSA